jgi:hypothetical protein
MRGEESTIPDSASETTTQLVSDQKAAPRAKKPYHTPSIRSERMFETMALTCGKTGNQGQCRVNRKSS